MRTTTVRHRISVGDSELECELVTAPSSLAAGPPLVFLHEGLGSLDLWRNFPDEIRLRCDPVTTLAYSRRGYGSSEPLSRTWDRTYMHEEALSELPALLDFLSLEHPILIGHSDGASIALIHAAAGHPVSGIVAIAPHVFVEDRTILGIRATSEAYRSGGLRARLERHHADADGLFEAWSAVWLDPDFRSWTIEDALAAISTPILVVQGSEDPYGTEAQVDTIRRLAAGPVQVLFLEGAGHAPHFQQPEVVLSEIVSFVDVCRSRIASPPKGGPR